MKIREAFSKDEEQDFLKEEQGFNPPYIRWMFLLFIILYAFFALTDFIFYPDEWQTLFIVRFAIVIPLLILVILFSYKRSLSKFHQYYIAFSFFVGGAGIAYMLILYPENIIYYGGLFLVYFSGYLLIRLRFYYATFSGLSILLFHIIGSMIINNELSETVLFGMLFYIGANLIGMVGAYQLEVKNRKQFLHDREIIQKNSELKQQYKEKDEQFNKLEQSIKKNEALEFLTKSLKESEEKYRDLFEQSVMAIFVHDMEGRIINVNNRACLQLKYTKEELLKLNIFDLLPSEADTVNQPKDEILRQWNHWQIGQQNIIEAEHQCKDGTIIPVRISAGAVEHKEGKRILAVVQDITEINTANTKLKQRKALIEGLFNHMTSGVAIYEVINDGLHGSDYIITDFNDISLSWENKTREEVVGKALSELHPNIDDSGIIDFFRKVWKTGEPIIFPAKQYVNGNYNRWHENRIFKLPSGEIVAMYDDVTERVLIENQRAKEHLDLLTSQKIAKLGTWRLDVKTNDVTMSEELYKIYGFDPTQPNPPVTEHMNLFTKQSWDKLSKAIALTSTKGIPYEMELERAIGDKPIGWLWVKGEAEYDNQGDIVSVIGLAQDITERKQLEQNLKEAHQIAKLGRWELIHNENRLIWSETIFDIFEIDSKRFESSYEGFLKVIHPDDRSTVDEAFQRSLANKRAYNSEHRLLMEDGRVKWVTEKCNTEFDEKGRPIRSVGVVQDITDFKKQEELKQTIENQWSKLIQEMPLGFNLRELIFDDKGKAIDYKFLSVNDFYENMIGLKREKIIGKRVTEVLPDIEDMWINKYEEVVLLNKTLVIEDYSRVLGKYFKVVAYPYIENQFVIIAEDITERKINDDKIAYASNHDYLTNLYNRRYFVNAFNKFVSQGSSPLGLMMIDINGLKIINDAYGHVRGDETIRQVANLLIKVFDQDEVVARIGGDEFAILAPHKNALQMQAHKDKLILLSQDIKIENIPVSIAIGYEILDDKDKDIDDLLTRAEKNLYRHKITFGESIRNSAIKAILSTLTDKYKEEKIHSVQVSQLCKQIGVKLGLNKEDIDILEIAGMYHDIGKISIPDAILNKPGKLTDEEYDIIKTHTQIGYKILRAADEYSGLAEYALSHHERWDGRGYPKGLKGKDIPLFSRIINVADAFEAMTADRPYRKGMPIEDAILEIKRCSGSQFDPEIADLFIRKVLK